MVTVLTVAGCVAGIVLIIAFLGWMFNRPLSLFDWLLWGNDLACGCFKLIGYLILIIVQSVSSDSSSS